MPFDPSTSSGRTELKPSFLELGLFAFLVFARSLSNALVTEVLLVSMPQTVLMFCLADIAGVKGSPAARVVPML